VALTCPNCGNERIFLVKTLQMHVLHIDSGRVEVTDETQPAVFELLCDECDTTLSLDGLDEALRREVLLTIGAR
jgi:hypothetical protein